MPRDICLRGGRGLGSLLGWPLGSCCLCTEPSTVVLFLNGHCQIISSETFQQGLLLLSHCCTISNSCTGSLPCGYVLLSMARLPGYCCPLISAPLAEPGPMASGLLSGCPSSTPRPQDGKRWAQLLAVLSNSAW